MSRPEFHKTEDGTKTTLIELNPGDCFESAVGYGCIVGQLTGGDALVEYIGAEKRQARVLGMTEVVKVPQEEFNRMQDQEISDGQILTVMEQLMTKIECS